MSDGNEELRRALREFGDVVVEAFKRDWWIFAGLWLLALIAAIVMGLMW